MSTHVEKYMEAERNLLKWKLWADSRDDVVSAALHYGVSVARIHFLTGLSQATIRKIRKASENV